MEGASKERITGAVILVAALAIAVPELLSGPDDNVRDGAPAVAEGGPPLTTYDLAIDPAARPAAARQQELAASAARAESEAIAEAVPPPVTAPPANPAPEPDAGAASSSPSPAPLAQQSPAARVPENTTPAPAPAAAPAAAGKWWVQLGSFSSADNAQRLARELRGKGFVIDVSIVKSGGRELHRVRAGPEKDRDTAVALRARLASAGQQGTLVAP